MSLFFFKPFTAEATQLFIYIKNIFLQIHFVLVEANKYLDFKMSLTSSPLSTNNWSVQHPERAACAKKNQRENSTKFYPYRTKTNILHPECDK